MKFDNLDLSTIRVKEYVSIEGFIIFLNLCCDFTDGLEGAHLQDSTVKRRGEDEQTDRKEDGRRGWEKGMGEEETR